MTIQLNQAEITKMKKALKLAIPGIISKDLITISLGENSYKIEREGSYFHLEILSGNQNNLDKFYEIDGKTFVHFLSVWTKNITFEPRLDLHIIGRDDVSQDTLKATVNTPRAHSDYEYKTRMIAANALKAGITTVTDFASVEATKMAINRINLVYSKDFSGFVATDSYVMALHHLPISEESYFNFGIGKPVLNAVAKLIDKATVGRISFNYSKGYGYFSVKSSDLEVRVYSYLDQQYPDWNHTQILADHPQSLSIDNSDFCQRIAAIIDDQTSKNSYVTLDLNNQLEPGYIRVLNDLDKDDHATISIASKYNLKARVRAQALLAVTEQLKGKNLTISWQKYKGEAYHKPLYFQVSKEAKFLIMPVI